ncbi:MCRI1 protein, partial [Polypterus senegalus]
MHRGRGGTGRAVELCHVRSCSFIDTRAARSLSATSKPLRLERSIQTRQRKQNEQGEDGGRAVQKDKDVKGVSGINSNIPDCCISHARCAVLFDRVSLFSQLQNGLLVSLRQLSGRHVDFIHSNNKCGLHSSPASRVVYNGKRNPSPRSPTNTGELFTPAHEENVRFIYEAWQCVMRDLGSSQGGERSERGPQQYVEKTPNPVLNNAVQIEMSTVAGGWGPDPAGMPGRTRRWSIRPLGHEGATALDDEGTTGTEQGGSNPLGPVATSRESPECRGSREVDTFTTPGKVEEEPSRDAQSAFGC